jgi:hypothetical protein
LHREIDYAVPHISFQTRQRAWKLTNTYPVCDFGNDFTVLESMAAKSIIVSSLEGMTNLIFSEVPCFQKVKLTYADWPNFSNRDCQSNFASNLSDDSCPEK